MTEVAEITESLYKLNHELAVVNKTLSLLRKLYETSLLILNPDTLTSQLTTMIRTDLDLTSVDIFPEERALQKNSASFPLIARDRTIGVMVVTLNRDYNTLSDHEKNSIVSTVDVVAIALDRANLHKELEDANSKLQVADRMKTQFL